MPGWMHSITAKVLGVGALALLMLIPLASIQSMVGERQNLNGQAASNVAKGWGGRQVIGGLMLAVPAEQTVLDANQRQVITRSTEFVLADRMATSATMSIERRRYGMYEVPVYVADVSFVGHVDAADIATFRQASGRSWLGAKAELRLPVADLQGLRDVGDVRVNGKPYRLVSSTARAGGLPVVSVPIDLDAMAGQSIDFTVRIKLAGTGSLQFLPMARSGTVDLQAPWADPSFVGASLPVTRRVDDRGFQAQWRVLDLNRDYGQHWNDGDGNVDTRMAASAFGVELFQPGSVYQQNDRAGKYALLFIAMTFVVFFLYEVLQRLRVHPVQYLLVGAAMVVFYVLLLALSEQLGFALAYLLAALAVVGIIAGYASAVLRARRAGWTLGIVLALLYAVLYGLIGAEQYALLIGAVVLLAVVALLMYLTRHIDWYTQGSTRINRETP
jgi:inner membrane protein